MSNRIAVLFGGQSSEHPVSLMSAQVVLANIPDHYEIYPVGITSDGRWFHYQGRFDDLTDDRWIEDSANEEVIFSPSPAVHGFWNLAGEKAERVDAVLPMLHGRNGEDGTIAAICQLAGIPCVGSGMIASAVAMDKEFTHIIAASIGIPMAKYMIVYRDEAADLEKLYQQAVAKLGPVCYVKPTKEGSSFGAHKADSLEKFKTGLADAFKYDDKILIEEFIPGTEVGCGILGKDEAGVVYEVVVETEMYGYAEKYDGFKTKIYYPAKNLSPQLQQQVIAYGRQIYKALGCQIYARMDFFATPSGVIFNELNTIPGFTSHSLYPSMFKAVGYSITELLDKMIVLALKGEK